MSGFTNHNIVGSGLHRSSMAESPAFRFGMAAGGAGGYGGAGQAANHTNNNNNHSNISFGGVPIGSGAAEDNHDGGEGNSAHTLKLKLKHKASRSQIRQVKKKEKSNMSFHVENTPNIGIPSSHSPLRGS